MRKTNTELTKELREAQATVSGLKGMIERSDSEIYNLRNRIPDEETLTKLRDENVRLREANARNTKSITLSKDLLEEARQHSIRTTALLSKFV